MGNGAIRPAGASYRNALSNGEFRDNGHEALNNFLAPTMGYLVYQEQIMQFLHDFCGYTMGEADIVRRGFAKKTGTEKFIPKIESGFIETMKEKYGVEEDEAKKLIVNFIQVITDASDYLFSENHALPYTYIGYIGAYLKYHYPLEFITTALNINKDKEDKTINIVKYANSINIKISSPKFGYAKGSYFMSKETNSIYKGVASVKNLNSKVADELYELSKNNKYDNFLDLLIDIQENTSCNSRQLEILIKLDYFDYFGKSQKLLNSYKYFQLLYKKKAPKKATLERDIPMKEMLIFIERNCTPTNSTYGKLDWRKALEEIYDNIPNIDINFKDKLAFQNEILGYIDYKNDKLEKRYVLITDVNTKYTPIVNTYCLNNGSACKCKINKKIWKSIGELQQNDIIYIHQMEKKFGWKKVGETVDKNNKPKPIFEIDESKNEWWVTNYNKVNIEEVLEEL
jgi:DNA polymerase-3 subunit alpha